MSGIKLKPDPDQSDPFDEFFFNPNGFSSLRFALYLIALFDFLAVNYYGFTFNGGVSFPSPFRPRPTSLRFTVRNEHGLFSQNLNNVFVQRPMWYTEYQRLIFDEGTSWVVLLCVAHWLYLNLRHQARRRSISSDLGPYYGGKYCVLKAPRLVWLVRYVTLSETHSATSVPNFVCPPWTCPLCNVFVY